MKRATASHGEPLLTARQVADKLHCDPSTVSRRARELGIDLRYGRLLLTQEEVAAIGELRPVEVGNPTSLTDRRPDGRFG